ncbi:dipeptide ABC transporter ATP-binding protein [Geminicoccus roseus]|uniref:dipeptide ABC transporter ATP-binding protein n=1 Tax=Geminicoccus roseus TaxID=404900 RepID=UPI0003F974BD|nr:ABC transporter ATP-binding protein [Geminicoccus roseus]
MDAAATLLEVDGLSIELRREHERRTVLDGVSFHLAERSVLGVLGESGSGKTILAKALSGWIAPPLHRVKGAVRYRGRDLFGMSESETRALRGRHIGYIGADPGSSFDPTLPVGVQIAEKLRAVRPEIGQKDAQRRTIDLLDRVRIPSAARRYREYPSQYSGGMLQRAMIVDALVAEPTLLVCDNVTQPLDVTVAAQIVRLLRDLREDIKAGILFIATSVPVVSEIADDLLVLSRGRIVERTTPKRLVAAPEDPYSRELLARMPRIWTNEPPLRSTADAQAAREQAGDRTHPILSVQDVTKHYTVPDRERFFGKQTVQAVRGVTFDVFPGDNFGLVGESGCGKSTLSRLLSWVEPPDQGRIMFDGQDIAAMSARERLTMRKGFQLLLQDPYNCIPPNLPVGRTIGFSLQVHGAGRKEIRDKVEAVMAEVGLPRDLLERLPIGLSAGQRQRINIARALILEPRLMILDETLSALDPMEQARLLDLFEKLQASHGLTYLFISHDLAMVRKVCTRIAVMYLGKVVELADNQTVFFNPAHPYTKAMLSAVPVLEDKPYRAEDCLLEGEPPSPIDIPAGCSFRPRCPLAIGRCARDEPGLRVVGQHEFAACHLAA